MPMSFHKIFFILSNFWHLIIAYKVVNFLARYRTGAIITHGLYIFYPIFQCGL